MFRSLRLAQLDHYNIVNSFQQGRLWRVGLGCNIPSHRVWRRNWAIAVKDLPMWSRS